MDYLALKTEIQTDPANLGIDDLIVTGRDNQIADILNYKQYRGPVPIVEISSYCVVNGIIGACEVVASNPTMPDQLRAVCITVTTLLRDDFRLTTCDTDDPAFQMACAGLIQAGLMTENNVNAMIAMGENRYSRAEVVFGPGTYVSHTDVAIALRGN